MKRLVRFAVLAGLAAAVVSAVRALRREQDPLPHQPTGTDGEPWPPLRSGTSTPPAPSTGTPPATSGTGTTETGHRPVPPTDQPDEQVAPEPDGVPVASSPGSAGAAWVAPTSEGGCPDGYPVKAKLSSKIFHSPGQLNYERTTPDRCYRSAAAAEADGMRAAKR